MPAVRTAIRRLGRIAVQAADPRIGRPSFTYKDAEMRRVRAAGHALGWVHPVWSVNDKDDAHTWAEQLGVRRPQLLGEHASAADVPWDALPERCVVKPVTGAGSVGVHLLHRSGGGWRDLTGNRTTTSAELAAELTGFAAQGRTSSALLVEELVEDPRRPGAPPVDWKVLTFFGRVGMVVGKALAFDAQGAPVVTWRFFDEHLQDLGQAFSGHQLDTGIAPPLHAEELVEMAGRISAAVPRAFLRVDLYDSASGPVFGEITPQPGWRMRIRRDVDQRLGELWEDAEARLLVRADAAGVLDPATAPLPEAAAARGGARTPLSAAPEALAPAAVAA